MSSLTFGAAALLLTLITPSLMVLAVYRVVIPRARALPSSEGLLLITGILCSWIFNGIPICSYMARVLSLVPSQASQMGSWANSPLLSTALDQGNSALSFFYEWAFWGHPISDSFFLFTAILHLRMLALTLGIIGLSKLAGKLECWAQQIPYRENPKGDLTRSDRILLWMAGVSPDGRDKQYYERYRIKFPWLSWFRDILLHPWSHLTLSNRQREILMVDVLTNDNHLYSGFLTSWLPTGERLGAIAMEYALRYVPVEGSAGKFRKELIKNNGELIIGAEKIATIHFWEIRKGTLVDVLVDDADRLAKLQWYMVLNHVFPEMIDEISVQVNLEAKSFLEFYEQLAEWADSSNLNDEFNGLKFLFKPNVERELFDPPLSTPNEEKPSGK